MAGRGSRAGRGRDSVAFLVLSPVLVGVVLLCRLAPVERGTSRLPRGRGDVECSSPTVSPFDPLVAAPLAEPVAAMRFDWPRAGRVRVRAEHHRDDARRSEEFELCWRTLPGGMLFETFALPGAEPDSTPPGAMRTSGTPLTPVQALVARDGRFLGTPHLGDLREVWRRVSEHRLEAAPQPLAELWPDWVERWIGVSLAPGEQRVLSWGEGELEWIRCAALDVECARLEYRVSRNPRRFLPRRPFEVEIVVAGPERGEVTVGFERRVEAELLWDGLRPRRIESSSRWTWRRSATEIERSVEHESRYDFDWDEPAPAFPAEVLSDALPGRLLGRSRTRRPWQTDDEADAADEADRQWWRELWRELPRSRRADVFVNAELLGALGFGTGRRAWLALRPTLRRLWSGTTLPEEKALEVRPWLVNGPPETSVDVLFVGDGYTADELASGKYWSDVTRVAGKLFEELPLCWYRDWFNVQALFLESRQSGCDLDARADDVDTALDTCFAGETERGMWVRNEARLWEVSRVAGWPDIVFVMVNSERCSGSGNTLFGFPAPLFTSGCRAADTAAHELGHSFAGLSDEYVDESMQLRNYALGPNVSRHDRSRAAQVPWAHFLALPGADRFDWFHEGGLYRAKGIHRPARFCRMRDSSMAFCPVCCEAVARSTFRTCGVEWDDAAYHRAHPLSLWER